MVAKSPISAPVCDCAALRALAPRPACINTIGLPAARAAAGGEELLRSANLLAVDRDHAGRAVVSQEFEEIGAFEPRLIAGRDDVGQRKPAPIGGTLEVAEQAAALADKGNASLDAALRLARVEHVQPHPIHVVRDAEAIRPHDGKSARPRGGGDGVLCRLIADLGEPGGEYQRRADAAARTGLDRRAHSSGRQREHGEVHALRQLVGVLEYRPAVDRLAAAANKMDIALEVVELERLQNDLAGAARARRDPDDGERARAQESGDGLATARVVRTSHAGPLSGWNIMRCVPSSSGCQ